jgi:hypothetical protein
MAKASRHKAQCIANKYPQEFAVSSSSELFCTVCSVLVTCDKAIYVERHRTTQKHQRLMPHSAAAQTFITPNTFTFTENVAKMFVSANIPLFKLRNPAVISFFAKIGYPLPSETSCRNTVLSLYKAEFNRIKDTVSQKEIFVVVDESDFKEHGKFINVLIGTLDTPEKTFLIDCHSINKTPTADLIAQHIMSLLDDLGCEKSSLLLLLSDAAKYMIRAGTNLKVFYPKMFHVTCLAHLLHNCAERVRLKYDEVDFLIAKVKAATVKNSDRRSDFDVIGSPPQPVLTRWGTWLNAASFYAQNLPSVILIVNSWPNDGRIVADAKAAVNQVSIIQDLITIEQCYSCISNCLLSLENPKLGLKEGLALLERLTLKFGEDPAKIRPYLSERLAGHDARQIVGCFKKSLSPLLYSQLLKSQCTSASVERSFSLMKQVLTDRRHFGAEHVKHYMIPYYNSNIQEEEIYAEK